jgi:hypothetical protein
MSPAEYEVCVAAKLWFAALDAAAKHDEPEDEDDDDPEGEALEDALDEAEERLMDAAEALAREDAESEPCEC